MASQLKGVPVAPLTGVLDVRSEPDNMEAGSLRYRQNFQTVNAKTLRRGFGWSKLLSKPQYNNTDLHDQLLTFAGTTREPITMLKEVESSAKVRAVFAATQSRVLKLHEYTGNWQLIGSGFGGGAGTDCSGPRFQCDILGDYVIVTNGYDAPRYHIIEQAPNEDGSLLSIIPDLDFIGLTVARKVWVWNNVVFFADVVMDGAKKSNRIIWSDYNSPLSFDSSVLGTITGFFDLDFGEVILGGRESSNSFLIYTDKRVWMMSVNQSGAGNPFVFQKLPGFAPDNPVGCLFYENTLVSVGDGHIYAGRDRLYYFNQFIGVPEPLEWAHLADAVAYENIRSDVCEAHVAAYHNKGDANEIYLSFLTTNSTNGCPDITLRINRTYKTVDIIDSGFTAFCPHRPQSTPTVRDMLVSFGVCTVAELTAEGNGWVNEGLPNPLPSQTSDTTPTCIYTTKSLTVGDVEVEDYTQASPDADSLCSLLDASGLTACEACDSPAILIGAHSGDWCLKQIGDVFYRERCANPTAVGTTGDYGYTSSVGTYILDGYDSIIRFAPAYAPEMLVQAVKLTLNHLPAPNTNSTISLRIGQATEMPEHDADPSRVREEERRAKHSA
jgi:hypothetical protein